MNAIKVVDASALAALVFGEPEAEAVAIRLEGSRLAGRPPNVCLVKMRRYPEQREALRSAFHFASRLAIEKIALDHAAALDLADAAGLTVYDASYLWLSRALGGELVTLHRKLAAAISR